MEMIFDTQGSGFLKPGVRQMMSQPEAPYLSGGLGDEIMLLEGLDASWPHGYSDGPAAAWTMPTGDPTTEYNFDPEVDLSGISGSRLGAPVQSSAWGRAARKYDYTGLGRADYKYTGLGRGFPMGKRGRYAYTGLGGGLGTVESDRAIATQIATAALNLCNGLCGAADLNARAGCRTACQSAYDTAMIAVTAAYPPGAGTPSGPPAPTDAERAAIQAKLDRIAEAASTAGGAAPPPPADSGISTNTLLILGLVGVGVIGAYVILK